MKSITFNTSMKALAELLGLPDTVAIGSIHEEVCDRLVIKVMVPDDFEADKCYNVNLSELGQVFINPKKYELGSKIED